MTPHTLLVTWEHGGAGREVGRMRLAFDKFHCQNDYCSQVAGRSSLSPEPRRKKRAGDSDLVVIVHPEMLIKLGEIVIRMVP